MFTKRGGNREVFSVFVSTFSSFLKTQISILQRTRIYLSEQGSIGKDGDLGKNGNIEYNLRP